MSFKPSAMQQAIFTWVVKGQGSAIVQAVAGAGKTTTLVEAIKLMMGKIFVGAFNKKIADEIKAKVGFRQGCFISTMHAAGFKAWKDVAKDVDLNKHKCSEIFKAACQRFPHYEHFEGAVLDLVSKAKQAGFGFLVDWNDFAEWNRLIEHYSIDVLDEADLVIKLARKTLTASNEMSYKFIDFDDMIYIPLLKNARFFKHDWVLIDEAQDTNAIRRELAMRLLKDDGRMIAVGDERQAIYGFTGADADALQLIRVAVNAIDLPLTDSYRCPKAVVAHAKQWVSHINSVESAPEGKVESLAYTDLIKNAQVGDAVLCRFNAPTVTAAYAFIAAGKAARVEGSEIGNGLIKLATRWKKIATLDQLHTKLDEYEARETKKYIDKKQPLKAEAVVDQLTCLRIIIHRATPAITAGADVLQTIVAEVKELFGDSENPTVARKPVILLSSIHKSKGREWHNVYWLQTGPSPYAKLDWEMVQEDNLCYVATTRAQSYLGLVELPPKQSSNDNAYRKTA